MRLETQPNKAKRIFHPERVRVARMPCETETECAETCVRLLSLCVLCVLYVWQLNDDLFSYKRIQTSPKVCYRYKRVFTNFLLNWCSAIQQLLALLSRPVCPFANAPIHARHICVCVSARSVSAFDYTRAYRARLTFHDTISRDQQHCEAHARERSLWVNGMCLRVICFPCKPPASV